MDFKDMEFEDWVEYLAEARVLHHDILDTEAELAFSEFLENAEAERVEYDFDDESEDEDEISLYNEVYEAVEEYIERVATCEKNHPNWEDYKEYVDAGMEINEGYSEEDDLWD